MLNGRLAALAVVALLLGTACGSAAGGDNGDSAPSPEGNGPDLPSAFTVSRIADFREAAGVVGFDIPKSDLYPLHWGYLFIQPAAELGPDTPRKATAIYKINGNFAEVTLAPLSFWPVGALSTGRKAVLGGRSGWIDADENASFFSAPFSTSDRFGEIWLQVMVPRSDEPLLEAIVASLKLPSP